MYIKDWTKAFLAKDVFSGTFVVTVGLFITAAFAYLLQITLGNLLSVENYGTFNALLSLTMILTVPSLAFTNSLIKTVADLKAKNQFDVLTNLFSHLSVASLIFGGFLFVILFFFRSYVGSYLNIDDEKLILVYGIYLGLSFINISPGAYLQGLLRFKGFALYSVLGGLLRFSLAVGAYKLFDQKTQWVFLGMGVALVAMYGVGFILLKKNFTDYSSQSLKVHIKSILKFGIATLFVAISMNLLNNVDVILVKHYFSAKEAGIYSATVTIGKILLFGAGAVTMVMYPQIAELYTRRVNFYSKFKQFFLLQLLLIIGGVGIFALFPAFIVDTLFNESFYPAITYLPAFSIFVGIYILINFLIMFLIAIEHARAVFVLGFTVVAQLILISFNNTTLNAIINVNIFVSGITLAFISTYCLKVLNNARLDNSTGI